MSDRTSVQIEEDTLDWMHELHAELFDRPRKVPLEATVRAGLELLAEDIEVKDE